VGTDVGFWTYTYDSTYGFGSFVEFVVEGIVEVCPLNLNTILLF
jgi:hypothetical protein